MTPTFSLLYTSARNHEIPNVIRRWTKLAAARWELQWCITTDSGVWRGLWDGTLNKLCKELKLRPSQFKIEAVKNPPFNCGRGWELAAKISTGQIMVCVSDDLYPCEKWDNQILGQTETLNQEWVMHVDDGGPHQKLTHPIMSRVRYESEGYFFYPHIQSMYNDDVCWRKAERDGVLIDARHILIKHLHPDHGTREKDSVDEVQSSPSRYSESKRLYDWLEKRGFPKPSGLVPKSKSDYAVYMQVIKDDFFLYEILERLVYEGVTKFFFSIPLYSWDGNQLESKDVSAILNAGIRLKEKYGCSVKCDYNWCREERLFRIERETRVRNIALAAMRKEGWHFALIVDSDELWVPGTLDKVHALASEGVQDIRVKMTTGVGMPPNSFLVDGKDCAHVYVGPDAEFWNCRESHFPCHTIEDIGIYHFSAVRRTKELLIEKMMESGHFDDPLYNFRKWIDETLPSIKVGSTNVHMYGDGGLWPMVRAWEQKDIKVLPETIKQFLQL